MKRRRVLYFSHTAKGGSAESLYWLLSAVDKAKFEPKLLLHSLENSVLSEKVANLGIPVIALDQNPRLDSERDQNSRRKIAHAGPIAQTKRSKEPIASLKDFRKFVLRDLPKIPGIMRVIRREQIDLIHFNAGLRNTKAPLVAAWLTGTPCICHVRKLERLSKFDGIFARLAEKIIFVSQAVAEVYFDLGLPKEKGAIIHNALDTSEFSKSHDVQQIRNEFGCVADVPVIGVVGRLDWWKGQDIFVQAVERLARHFPTIRGLIVGESEQSPKNRAYLEKLQRLVQSLGLEERIVFTGYRKDVPAIMSAMNVVVLSSTEPEPFGRVVIEGMAAGKPVVATAAGGVLDIIDDGRNGLLVPPGDADAMADAIQALLSDRERADRIGREGRRDVEEKFTVGRHAILVQDLYDAVLKKDETASEHA